MDILTKLASAEQWEAFYEYKATSEIGRAHV